VSQAPALRLEGYGVAFGENVVLAEIDLEIPQRSLWNLLGPSGAGKSTLLRTLVGLNDAQPEVRTWGEVQIDGELALHARRRKESALHLRHGRRLSLVVQNARFLTSTVHENLASGLQNRSELTRGEQTDILCAKLEANNLQDLCTRLDESVLNLSLGLQRRLAITRACLIDPSVLFVDEATVSLEVEDARLLLDLLQRTSQERAVVFVTHNRKHAQLLGGRTAVLAGGRIQEVSGTADFFDGPSTEAGRVFLRTGGSVLPSPTARPEDLDESVPPPPPLPAAAKAAAQSRYVGPRGFYWIYPGALGGLPRPGIFAELIDDLSGLQRLGIRRLVTLEETETVPRRAAESAGIKLRFFPIEDMQVPSVERCAELCAELSEWMRQGEAVALHCRAGLGRTGTMLACQLIWDGKSALDALELVRNVNKWFVQSDEQIAFLDHFDKWLDQTGRAIAEPPG
jgi:atypical dual specificity phosphatase